MPKAAKWRIERAGSHFYLRKGSRENMVTLSLGMVSESQAQVAAERMNAEMEKRQDDRILRLYEEDHVPCVTSWRVNDEEPDFSVERDPNPKGGITGREAAIRYLTHDHALDLDAIFAPVVDYGGMTVEEYFDSVFWLVRSNASSPIGVSADTAKTEMGYWRNVKAGRGILQGEIGQTRLRDLTDQHWERWQESQAISGRSKVLRRNAYSALLTYARRQGHISYKPEFYRIKGSTKRTRPQVDPLTLDEFQALLKVADPMRRAMWAVGAGQGLRPGELVRVSWDDVDWSDQVLAVRGTKTEESAAAIPMTPIAYEVLRDYWLAQGQPAQGLCFTYRGQKIGEYKNSLAADAKEAGIERTVTPYLLRHSFATLAWSLGIPQDVARRIMRHTTNAMLDQVYCRPRPKDMVAKVQAFKFAVGT